jgi:polyhydroxyalkanoate synthesis regulator phasin
MMFDVLKKTLLAGIGLAANSRNHREEIFRKIAEELRLSEDDGKAFVEELMKKSTEKKENFEKEFSQLAEKTLKMLNISTASEIDEIRRKLDSIEEFLRKQAEQDTSAKTGE